WVDHQSRYLRHAAPPGTLVDRERLAHGSRREPRHGIRALAVPHGGPAPVAHRHRDAIRARRYGDELLVDHALVGALRLLEGADPHGVIRRELAHGSAVVAERHLDMVLRQVARSVPLKAQGMIGE